MSPKFTAPTPAKIEAPHLKQKRTLSLALSLGLGLGLSLALAACSGGTGGKPNPRQSEPKALDAKGGKVAPTKVEDPTARAAPGAERVRKANPHLAAPEPPTPASPPRQLNFDGKTRRDIVNELGYTVPSEWATQTPENRMRLAQYDLPGEGGGASLVLYRLPGGGGTVDQNIDRWVAQFEQPDGSDTRKGLKVSTAQVPPFKVTRVDLRGTYEAASMRPGAKAEGPKPDTRMLAAIVEGEGNPYFFKIVGPAVTVKAWEPAFGEMVTSFKKGE